MPLLPTAATKDLYAPAPGVLPNPAGLTAEDEELLRTMPLRRKLGQMFMIGFMGKSIDNGLDKMIKAMSPGSVIFFGRNIESARQLSELTHAAQKASIGQSGLPLLVGIDQEGGSVVRIKTAMPLPSALAIGETGRADIAEKSGQATAQLLKTLGFNMNLAPVLDIANPDEKTFIGTRTYGRDPQVVSKMAVRFGAGLLGGGVLPTGKHFPGHGGLSVDSHQETPQKQSNRTELERLDFVPFRGMQNEFKNGWAVMLAHVSYPALDASGIPATFSKPIVTGVLRQDFGFDGLVITDDIEMAGAFAIKEVGERAVRAVEAGVDIVMVAWNRRLQIQVLRSLEQAVRSGRIPEARIDESVRRIIAAKRKFATDPLGIPTAKQLQLAVRNPSFREIAEATIMAKLSQPGRRSDVAFREYAAGKPILVFSPSQRFSSTFRSGVGSRHVRFFGVRADRPHEIDRVMRSNPSAVGVFYVSGPIAAQLAGRISDDAARRMLVVTVEAEGLMKNADSFRHIADVYYRHPNLGSLVARQYFDETADLRGPATGTLKRKSDPVLKSASGQ